MTTRSGKLRPVTPAAAKAPSPDGQRDSIVDLRGNLRLTADRVLVRAPDESERRSKGGLLIPATAASPLKRCAWSEVVLVGPDTRNVKPGDQVLFIPHSGLEVDVKGEIFLLLRERDVQAIASDRQDAHLGQYL